MITFMIGAMVGGAVGFLWFALLTAAHDTDEMWGPRDDEERKR